MSWDPSVYLKFGDERTRPAADLLARVTLRAPKRVIDVGCGPGNSTALLAARYPDADLAGLDSSADMLREASASGVKARWIEASFDTWAPDAPYDLIYANAAFQWSDDPIALTQRLFQSLPSNGALAFQVPQNFDQASHVEVRAAVDDSPARAKLIGARQYDPGFAKAADYAHALAPLGAALDIWTTEYLHFLSGDDPVFRWMSGTGLRPFSQRLEGEERTQFEAAVRARLRKAYPPEPDGRTLFPFKRLFVIATKAQA
ncbi:MAG TPA: methyltransferase domain-containing protein [Vitreimonas sp.]|nr:methyltransferase domain-containing protein [Vitreimonas sp.]